MAAAPAVANAAPEQRIISLSPGLTELVFDAGAGKALVGVSAYSDYPKTAARLPTVGDAFHVDMERLVALEPDVILVWRSASPPDLISRLKKLDYHVAVFEPRTLSDIGRNLRRIGKLAGTTEEADKAATAFQKALAKLRQRYANADAMRVFFQIGAHPLYTINGKQIISQGLAVCGGQNIFADLPTLAATVSVASVVARNPDMIVTTSSASKKHNALAMWRKWPDLAAVKNNALVTVPAGHISRATPRMLEGIGKICRALDRVRRNQSD